jgi:hypothetical protein
MMAETHTERIHRLYKRCPECDVRLDRANRILCDRCEREAELLRAEAD